MILQLEPSTAGDLRLPATFRVPAGIMVTLALGGAAASARAVPAAGAALGLGRRVARSLGLPLPIRLRGRWHPESRTLRLGPAVGILVRKAPSPYGPFGPQASFIRELMAAADRLGVLLYAFGPGDVSFSHRRVSGYRYRGNGLWSRVPFPYPDVLWDRGFFRGAAYGRYWRTRARLARAHRGLRFVNSVFGDKWTVHRILLRHPEIRPHLPETRRCRGAASIAAMVRRHGVAYLKPAGGAKGVGIMRLERVGPRRYRLRAGVRSWRGSLSGLAGRARRRASRRYLVQQGIDLARPFGRPGDLRLVVQKDGAGRWQVTGGAMRVAAPGRITSNIHRGGHAQPMEAAVRAVVGDERYPSTMARINWLATEVARTVERARGPAGEMGVDLALDGEGRVWFLETNSKLARTIFLQLGQAEVRRRSVERPLLWAARLSGFTLAEDEEEAGGSWPASG